MIFTTDRIGKLADGFRQCLEAKQLAIVNGQAFAVMSITDDVVILDGEGYPVILVELAERLVVPATGFEPAANAV